MDAIPVPYQLTTLVIVYICGLTTMMAYMWKPLNGKDTPIPLFAGIIWPIVLACLVIWYLFLVPSWNLGHRLRAWVDDEVIAPNPPEFETPPAKPILEPAGATNVYQSRRPDDL